MNNKVSFDFDGTLDKQSVKDYAKHLVNGGYEVWITTARFESLNDYNDMFLKTYGIKDLKAAHRYLFEVALEVGIADDHIHFCNMEDKHVWLKDKGFVFHLDDDKKELNGINKYTDIAAISVVGNNNWKMKCDRVLSNKGGSDE